MHTPDQYRVEERKNAKGRTVYVVARPDGSIVNEHEHQTRKEAEHQLAVLRALKGLWV